MPMTLTCRIAHRLCSAAVVALIAQSAAAQLLEENVLMIWNHADETSRHIQQRYQELHPNVIYFELEDDENPLPVERGIDYTEYPAASAPNPICLNNCAPTACETCSACDPNQQPAECVCCSCPSFANGVHVDGQGQSLGWAMNEFYITPNMYEHFIAEPLR